MPETLRIDLSGSPHEIGVEHGRLLAAQIKSQISIYDAMFKKTSNMDWAAAKIIAQDYAVTLQRLTPEIYSEMEGIAEGSGLDILDIVTLNCRSEIALGMFSDGCTSLGWVRSDGVFLAQNWDWTARVKDNVAIMSIDQPGKPKIFMVNEAGLVGKIGFNSSSVGVCMNAIRAKPADSSKIPFHVAARLCLEASSTAAAIERLQALGGIASAQHLLLADPTGPISMELSPRGDSYISPDEDGVVCHTNHLIENRHVDERPWLSGSPIRLDRARMLTAKLAKSGAAVDDNILRKEIFSDTFNAPQAICCQENPERPIETRSRTLFCIVMKLVQGQRPTAKVVMGMPGTSDEGPVLSMG
ncbi:hypothetical protein B0A52_08304 [Exophiala mesophila]|uniref:Peptidase C45 hydrolase domain-containing protein n=1 Tax=Exophiala mesophila TaxID=212818 RepID=A0A438MTM1_EXOME|nr:hypothetical protein B0A52_08304 [Exophiala mesophila]